MTRFRNNSFGLRVLWLIPVGLAAALSIIATGGGGDGASSIPDIDDDRPPTILPNYNFFLANLPGDALLTATIGNLFTASIDIDGLLPGNIDVVADASNSVTFGVYRIRQGARFDVTVTEIMPSPLAGSFTVNVIEELAATAGEEPTSGAFEVITPAETVTVSVQANSITLALPGAGSAVYNSWQEIADLVEDDAQDTWQRRAALGASALEFIVALFFDVADVLDELELAATNNPIIEACDLFPGTPPPGVLGQGEIRVTWLGSGELSEGDDFDWLFNQCWSDTADELIDGTITLDNYTETIDFNNNTLFEIGFGGLSGQPGGVIYDLTVSETQDNLGIFTIAPEDVISVSGGFALIIQAP